MSTHWGFHCRTCDKSANYENWFNHGEQILSDLYAVRTQIAIIYRVSRYLELSVSGEQSCSNMLNFLTDHYNHDLCIKNEYGETEEIQPTNDKIISIETKKPENERVVYQLIGRDKFRSEIQEVERGQPSIRHSIMIPSNRKQLSGIYSEGELEGLVDPARRFYMTKQEPAIFVTYEEK